MQMHVTREQEGLTSGIALLCGADMSAKVKIKGMRGCVLRCRRHARHFGHSF